MIERNVTLYTPLRSLPKQVPSRLWGYVFAFLRVGKPMARFYWLDSDRWLFVQLVRTDFQRKAGVSSERAHVRIKEAGPPFGVTPRELDVLTLVALGLTNIGIAQSLGTSSRTVSTQMEKLLTKLGASTRAGLASLAVDAGLLKLPLPGGKAQSSTLTIASVEEEFQAQSRRNANGAAVLVSERAPLRIGVVKPQGPDGTQLIHGATLAANELNGIDRLNGRPVELLTQEVKIFDWPSIEQGLDQLRSRDCDAVITNYVGAEHPEFLDAAATLGVPILHTSTYEADLQRVEADPHRYGLILQTCASEIYYGSGLLRTLAALEQEVLWQPKTRHITALQQESSSMKLVTPSLEREAKKQSWKFAAQYSTPVGKTHWQSLLREIKSSQTDVLFVSNFVEREMIAFQDALRAEPIDALVYFTYAPSIPDFIEQLGAKANGIMWATTTGTYLDKYGKEFQNRYFAQFGLRPGWSQAGAAYDQVMMLAAAWTSVDADEAQEVVQYIRRWPYRGVNGVYYFSGSRSAPELYPDTTHDAALAQAHLVYQVQNGKQVLLAPEPFGSISKFQSPPWFREVT
jgi:branched-chain amino acid transport system substrate-binding protein